MPLQVPPVERRSFRTHDQRVRVGSELPVPAPGAHTHTHTDAVDARRRRGTAGEPQMAAFEASGLHPRRQTERGRRAAERDREVAWHVDDGVAPGIDEGETELDRGTGPRGGGQPGEDAGMRTGQHLDDRRIRHLRAHAIAVSIDAHPEGRHSVSA